VERPAYVYLFYHQVDGQTRLLFPNKAQPGNLLKVDQEVTIPAPGEPFRFRVRAPFGQEALQVLAATQPIAELTALDVASGKAPLISADLLHTLHDRIASHPEQFGEHRVRLETRPRTEVTVPDRKATRVGLFIGLNKYETPKVFSEHEEARRSAEHMAKLMQARGGIDPQHVRVLTGADSTRANIEQAITGWLPTTTQPGDTVFIFYCGHGAQLDSSDPSRPDRMESFLSVSDDGLSEVNKPEVMDARLRERMILETTLARWLQELPGRQIVLLLEACHSGGFVAPTKGTSAPPLKSFFIRQAARVKGISQLNLVIISACGPDETDRFTSGPDAISWMPFFLTQAIEQLPGPVTIRQAYEFYQQAMRVRLAAGNASGQQEPAMSDQALLPIVLAPAAGQ
jgi:hypothetical protein